CEHGSAPLYLSDLVGLAGRVIAIDRSRRFLDHLERRRAGSRPNIQTIEHDLGAVEDGAVPSRLPAPSDAAWCRWILTFVPQTEDVIDQIIRALRPGGTIVVHE